MKNIKKREQFLEEVRKALLTGVITPARPRSELQVNDFPPSGETKKLLIDRFIGEAVRVGALIHRAADPEEVRKHLKGITHEHNARLAVRWDDPLLDELGVDGVLAQMGVEVVVDNLRNLSESTEGEAATEKAEKARAYLKQKMAEADLGLSTAHYALAETGTLVLIAGEGKGRAVTALPPVHVAVLEAERLVPSLGDFLAIASKREGKDIPSLDKYISFITGPSRTGDIELALTIGVHGPGEVHIILFDPAQERK